MYDLVVLGYAADYLPIFTEVKDEQNTHLISPFWSNERELLHFLLRMDLAYKKRKLPISPNSNPLLEKVLLLADTPVCYIFFREWYPLFASGYIKKIKEMAPDTKTCWFFSDLVDTYPGINIERMQREFDLILSFDPEDAKRYGFVYCPLSYSVLPEMEKWREQVIGKDIFFMGYAKQRLDTIFAVYERLRNADLDCDFNLVGVPLKEQRYADEINYCNFVPYRDYLHMTLSSRCILELLQDPAHHGFTARTGEALVYGRKLLSNNTYLVSAPFYNSRQISTFSDAEDIDVNFISDHWQSTCLPTVFSPHHTLKLIEDQLNIRFAINK